MDLYEYRGDVRFYEKKKRCEDCEIGQVMRMNLYDATSVATFGIRGRVREPEVMRMDLYEYRVRRSALRKKCED
ncbi:unnamed protein product [Trichogramma brassicae]|uniref:Uncharacterized protein n=1 Tax=Trichogramma brassicae TaxID=86971 RepID=A0A6H5J431_9HYME|nr:unnamed protein product [Trichogramma brassicae]